MYKAKQTKPKPNMNSTQKKFNNFLIKNNFMNIEVPGDGNCFFHSINLHYVLQTKTIDIMTTFIAVPPVPNTYKYHKNPDSSIIRNEIFEFMQNNEEIREFITIYGGYEDKAILDNEINDMNKDTKYDIPLFDLFPVIVATLYQCSISIYAVTADNKKVMNIAEPQIYKGLNSQEDDPVINLLYINQSHYELLYKN